MLVNQVKLTMKTSVVAALLAAAAIGDGASAFAPMSTGFRVMSPQVTTALISRRNLPVGGRRLHSPPLSSSEGDGEWTGEVVSNTEQGIIKGCSIERQGDSMTDWKVTIDGIEADLGKFSEAIMKKLTADGRRQRFQGFRPGTIPPHILPTYVAFAMDECAREATLEAMEQNNVRPFENAREDFFFDTISIPPPVEKGKKKKKSSKKKKKGGAAAAADLPPQEPEVVEEPAWLTFETMKEAIDAGWKPGQSFSFVAHDCKGQLVKDSTGATPIGDQGYQQGSTVNWNAIDTTSESAT